MNIEVPKKITSIDLKREKLSCQFKSVIKIVRSKVTLNCVDRK
jgi:hypothetical protein